MEEGEEAGTGDVGGGDAAGPWVTLETWWIESGAGWPPSPSRDSRRAGKGRGTAPPAASLPLLQAASLRGWGWGIRGMKGCPSAAPPRNKAAVLGAAGPESFRNLASDEGGGAGRCGAADRGGPTVSPLEGKRAVGQSGSRGNRGSLPWRSSWLEPRQRVEREGEASWGAEGRGWW